MADLGNEFSDRSSSQSKRADQPEVINGELQVTPQMEKLWNDFMKGLEEKEKSKKQDEASAAEPSDKGKKQDQKDAKSIDISPYEYPGYGDDYTAAPPQVTQKEGGPEYRKMPKDSGGLDYPDFASDTTKPDPGIHPEAHTYSDLPYSITDKKQAGRSYEVQEMIDTIERIDKWTDEQKSQDRQKKQAARDARANPLELANKAVDEFNKADNKAAALERLAPQFQRAIELSDSQAKATMKKIAGSLAISEPERAQARAANEQANALIEVYKMTVPEDKKESVNQSLNAYEHSVTDSGKENALREIARVAPGLAMAIKSKEEVRSQTAPILAKEDAILKNLENAAEIPISLRETFAGALQAAGKFEEAAKMTKQAVDIFINVLLAQDRAKQTTDATVEAQEEPKEPVAEWEI